MSDVGNDPVNRNRNLKTNRNRKHKVAEVGGNKKTKGGSKEAMEVRVGEEVGAGEAAVAGSRRRANAGRRKWSNEVPRGKQ